MNKAKKKTTRGWMLACAVLLVTILIVSVVLLLDDSPVLVYRGVERGAVVEFFMVNEDKFEFVISRLIETNYTGNYLQVAITKRTNVIVFSRDQFETYISPEALGITMDDELAGCLRTILTGGKLGMISIRKYPAATYPVEYPMIFDVSIGLNTPFTQSAIYYYFSTERSQDSEKMQNVKGNWYMYE